VDPGGVHAYKDAVVAQLYTGCRGRLHAHGVEIVSGRGQLAEPGTVAVGDDRCVGEHVVLATGSRPHSPLDVDIGGKCPATRLCNP
jgi:dihydrolipoamide dehydrogenase